MIYLMVIGRRRSAVDSVVAEERVSATNIDIINIFYEIRSYPRLYPPRSLMHHRRRAPNSASREFMGRVRLVRS
jgi:hypothetical protein